MVPKGLITYIALIGLSVGIFFTYLQPNFDTVRASQDKLTLYKSEREKVKGVNEKLNSLVAEAALISEQDRILLNQYLPATVDDVQVQRDILAIFQDMGMVPTALSADGVVADTGPQEQEPGSTLTTSAKLVAHQFGTGGTMRYEEVLALLRLLGSNAYPLDVVELSVTTASDSGGSDGEVVSAPGSLSVDLGIATYALTREAETQ